ncbi:MAG: cytochrome c biogenesis protein CcdA [Defluviitaleaceae bacterium]|nr:cytochrome c biogenesis protein CcdA [Defluviitaleaceae bacterium]
MPHYFLSFLEGMIVFVSPCLLPMLPIYISYFAGKDKHPLANSIGFVAGFTVIFVALGAFAGAVGGFLLAYDTIVNIVAGLFIIVIGLTHMNVLKFPAVSTGAMVRLQSLGGKRLTFATSIVFGMVFAVAWTPCVGTFLAAALLRASVHGSTGGGMLALFIFSMGIGIPFVVSAVLVDRLQGAFDFIKRHYRVINIGAGCLLVLMGVLIMTGVFGRYLALFN